MTFIVATFRHRPYLVSTIVYPAPGGFHGRNVFAPVRRINEQEVVPVEAHLHQTATELRDDDQPCPLVRDFVSIPPVEGHGPDAAGRMRVACRNGRAVRSSKRTNSDHRDRKQSSHGL